MIKWMSEFFSAHITSMIIINNVNMLMAIFTGMILQNSILVLINLLIGCILLAFTYADYRNEKKQIRN
jgi:hypothetical protein